MQRVVVSGAWARHAWACSREHVEAVCHGRCCECNGKSEIPLFPDEERAFVEAARATGITGWTVEGGVLRYTLRKGGCPGKLPSGACRWHGTNVKPWSCIASPFALSPSGGTLIIRRRYAQMGCHGQGQPAHRVFRPSLELIFGHGEAARVCDLLERGTGDVIAEMSDDSYTRLRHIGHVRAGPASTDNGILDLLSAPD